MRTDLLLLILIGLAVVMAFPLMMRRTVQRPFVLVRLRDPRDIEHYPDPSRPEQCAGCRRIYPCPYTGPYGDQDEGPDEDPYGDRDGAPREPYDNVAG